MIIVSDNTATNVVIDAVGMATSRADEDAGHARHPTAAKDDRRHGGARGDENVASPASLARSLRSSGVETGCGRRAATLAAAFCTRARRRSARGAWQRPSREQDRHPRRRARGGGDRRIRGSTLCARGDGDLPAHRTDGERAIREVADAVFSYFERLATRGVYGRQTAETERAVEASQ